MYRLVLDVEHLGYAGPADVSIHDTDHVIWIGCKGVSKGGRETAFTHTTLPT